MAISNEHIKGVRLASVPIGISKCGMSRAKYAQDCKSQQWYELSLRGHVIGNPIDFDFYGRFGGGSARIPSDLPGKQLTRA